MGPLRHVPACAIGNMLPICTQWCVGLVGCLSSGCCSNELFLSLPMQGTVTVPNVMPVQLDNAVPMQSADGGGRLLRDVKDCVRLLLVVGLDYRSYCWCLKTCVAAGLLCLLP